MLARHALAAATLVIVGCNSTGSRSSDGSPGSTAPTTDAALDTVAPRGGADVIREFWALIDRGETAAAAAMLDPSAAPDEATRAAWRANFESIDAVQVTGVEAWEKASWPPGTERYQVTLAIQTRPDDPAHPPPIPQYGWQDGSNVRWMDVRMSGATFLVASIATGP